MALLGELLENLPKEYTISSIGGTNRPQRKESLPVGINKKESHKTYSYSNIGHKTYNLSNIEETQKSYNSYVCYMSYIDKLIFIFIRTCLGSRLIHVTNVTNVTNVTVILSPEIELSLSFRGKKNISDDVPGGFLNEY